MRNSQDGQTIVDIVNSAIRLGLRIIPPIGSIYRPFYMPPECRYKVLDVYRSSLTRFSVEVLLLDGGICGYPYYISLEDFYQFAQFVYFPKDYTSLSDFELL